MGGVITLLPLYAFMAWTGTTLRFVPFYSLSTTSYVHSSSRSTNKAIHKVKLNSTWQPYFVVQGATTRGGGPRLMAPLRTLRFDGDKFQ
jgi:ABC-type uncharacterized transport system permease subunit